MTLSVRVEVIGPGGDVVEVLDVVEGQAVRPAGPTIRVLPAERPATKRGGSDGA